MTAPTGDGTPAEKSVFKLKPAKREDVQCLRALAIFSVLAFHLKPALFPNGYLGVDIFFVISGYLMTVILNFTPSSVLTLPVLGRFYSRRIKRIFPIYLLVIFVTLIVCRYYLIELDYEQLKTDTVWSVLFGSNVQSLLNREDYFQQFDSYKFLLHTWSLSVEIQYYLIAPVLLWVVAVVRRPTWVLLALMAGSWGFQTCVGNELLSFGFVGARLWQFLAGSLVHYHEKRLHTRGDQSRLMSPILYVSNCGLLVALVFFPWNVPNSRPYDVLVRLMTTALTSKIVFYGTQVKLNFAGHELWTRMLSYVGTLSYSIYLIHWPYIVLTKYLMVFDRTPLFVCVFVIFAFSFVQYRCFEAKLPALPDFKLYFLIVVLYVGIGVTLLAPQTFTRATTPHAEAIKANQEIVQGCAKALEDLRKCHMEPPIPYNHENQPLDTYLCSYEGTGNLTILVTGNSFAMRQIQGIIKAAKNNYKKIYLAAQSMCTIFLSLNLPSWRCGHVSNEVLRITETLKPDMMIVTQRLSMGDELNSPLASRDAAKHDKITEVFRSYWPQYAKHTKKIVVIEPHPTFYGTPKENLAKLLSLNTSLDDYYITRQEYEKEVDPGWWRTLESLDSCPICSTIAIKKYFCHSNDMCDIYDGASLLTLYCDQGHFSPVGVERFSHEITWAIEKEAARLT